MECDPKEVRKYFIHLEMNSSYLIRLKRLIEEALKRRIRKIRNRYLYAKTIRFRGSMEYS